MNVFITLILAKTMFFQPVYVNVNHIVSFSSHEVEESGCILDSAPDKKDRGGAVVYLTDGRKLCVKEYAHQIAKLKEISKYMAALADWCDGLEIGDDFDICQTDKKEIPK